MLICVFPFCMLFFFIVFNISWLHDSKKYVINNKTTTSTIWLFMNKRIFLFINSIWHTQNTIYKELQCIELQCIPPLSFALLSIALLSLKPQCIEPQCIPFLCITAQCIALQGLQIPDRKDPNFFANVRTWLPTDFIDFLGYKSIFLSGISVALRALLWVTWWCVIRY